MNISISFSFTIMGDKMLELQQQVRNNSDELQDYLRELGGWVTQMEKKDEQLKKKKTESKSANFEAPRSVEELKRKSQPREALLQNEIQVSEKKMKKVVQKPPSPPTSRKEDKISASNYDAWSKFDVEKALDDIDKNEKLQDSELSDMNADMRLQRAVVEKDRGNECFKVKITLAFTVKYRTHAIITRGLYIFTPYFTAVYIVERLVLQTIYVLNKEIHQFLGLKSTVYN